MDVESLPLEGYEGCIPGEECDGCTTEAHFLECDGSALDDDLHDDDLHDDDLHDDEPDDDDLDDDPDDGDLDDNFADDDEPVECTPENGCQTCPDCFEQCVCSGDSFTTCQDLCGNTAPPAECSPDNDCSGCDSCFAECVCHGGDFTACVIECDTCTPAAECAGCDSCSARCICEGTAAAQCAAQCQVQPEPVPCGADGDCETVVCGEQTCESFDAREAVFPACCPAAANEGSVNGEPSPCGLDPRSVLDGAPACWPLNAPLTPAASETSARCERQMINRPPWQGETLLPCCTLGGQCGLFDSTAGLGCLPQGLFGFEPSSCSIEQPVAPAE